MSLDKEANNFEGAIPISFADIEFGSMNTDRQQQRLNHHSSLGGLRRNSIDPANSLPIAYRSLLQQYGKNIPSRPPSHLLSDLISYFFGGFGTILLVASILVFVAWKPLGQPPAVSNLDSPSSCSAAWQDFSLSRVMASISSMLPDECIVMRDGVRGPCPATNIVPGDVLMFKAGNKLPADLRFIEVSTDAKFNRSILTGESVPLRATIDSTDDNYLETKCIGLQGTYCMTGSGVGIVLATGDRTVFGKIARLAAEPKTGMTTLQREIFLFCLAICSIMAVIIVLVLVVWGTWLHKDHKNWTNVPMLIVAIVSVAVAFIPEGLPIVVTATLTITTNLMRKKKILCKSLKSVETLGALSVICSDKTGTLTKNNMSVTHCSVSTLSRTVKAVIDHLFREQSHNQSHTAMLCNSGEFDSKTSGMPLADRKITGDATDQAILRFSETLGPVADIRALWTTRFELAFNSKNKFMIRVLSLAAVTDGCPGGRDFTLSPEEAKDFSDHDLLLTVKGAPDILLSRCSAYVSPDGSSRPLDTSVRAMIESVKDDWSRKGKRVILLAKKVVSGLTQVGMVGIVDPPREEIPRTVLVLRQAGMRMFMVTGDFSITACAIARECGIMTAPASGVHDHTFLTHDNKASNERVSIVISGPEIITLNDAQWDRLCRYREIVDGVNDAPSLKAADIGIALGSGSDIAIEAADMVLLDMFDAVVDAVEYGRVVLENLKKTIAYLLPAGSFAEFWPVITNVVFGLPQILSSFLMIIICFSMAYWYLQQHGVPFSGLWFGFGAASSIYFMTLVVMQWFNLMTTRTRRASIFEMPPLFNPASSNLYLLPAIAFSLSIVFFWLYVLKFQSTLGTTTVPVEFFFLPMAFGFGILILDEDRKYVIKRYPRSIVAKCAW
ncbi:Na,H/K antiporter P-type ATPase [Lipomyces japonicus]|uniref:Na,H/K antiporter P-type ATPase n=1 Tax=Lipomyces japonicus TaxID=56871 RepID=UPI0034CE8B21